MASGELVALNLSHKDHRMRRTVWRLSHIHSKCIIVIIHQNHRFRRNTGEKLIYLSDNNTGFFPCFHRIEAMRGGNTVERLQPFAIGINFSTLLFFGSSFFPIKLLSEIHRILHPAAFIVALTAHVGNIDISGGNLIFAVLLIGRS